MAIVQGCCSVTQSLITGKIYNSKMGSDSSEPEEKEASWNTEENSCASRPVTPGSLFREAGGNERHED